MNVQTTEKRGAPICQQTDAKTHNNRGFSLMEMLIVLAVMVTLSGLSIFKYREYTTNIDLDNITLDAALVVREAQTFGVTTLESKGSGFNNGYGVHFDESEPSNYTFFVDSTNDDLWLNNSTEVLREIYLEPGYTLADVCVGSAGALNCTATELVIAFKRPNLSARIFSQNSGTEYPEAQIVFSAPDGSTSTVHATITGQIYVE